MGDLNETDMVRKYLEKTFSDPLVKLLAPTSLFTEIQLESLIIDYISGAPTNIYITSEKKAEVRKISRGTTRGSYNRTLAQSKMKLTSMLCSLILTGYLGILDTNSIINLAETVANLHQLQEQTPESQKSNVNESDSESRDIFARQAIAELEYRLKELTEHRTRRIT